MGEDGDEEEQKEGRKRGRGTKESEGEGAGKGVGNPRGVSPSGAPLLLSILYVSTFNKMMFVIAH